MAQIDLASESSCKKAKQTLKEISEFESPTNSLTDFNQLRVHKCEDSSILNLIEVNDTEHSLEPSKANTLYLPIQQIYFDAFIEGSQKEIFREIKQYNYKTYLECDVNGYPYYNDKLIDVDSPLCRDINIWNGGVYPFIPKGNHKFLYLAVGFGPKRDEILVEIANISFQPLSDKDGKAFRFNIENGKVCRNDKGELCSWNIVYHFGRVIKVRRFADNPSLKTNKSLFYLLK